MIEHRRVQPIALAAWAALLLGPAGAHAQVSQLVNMRDFAAREVRFEAFALDSATTVSVTAVGAPPAHSSSSEGWIANAWILNALTREVVWALDRDAGGETRFDGVVSLGAGTYLAYFATDPQSSTRSPLDRVLRRRSALDRSRDAFELSIRGDGQLVAADEMMNAPGTFARLTGGADGDADRITFSASRDVEIEIYALGEMATESAFDYGFIMDAGSRHVLWQLDYASSDHAGGASRNRVDRARLHLPPGTYVASFTRNGSHHPGDWTDAPPYDPSQWGLTLTTPTGADAAQIAVTEYVRPTWENSILEITGIGDRVNVQQGFSLRDSTRVRVYAVAEGSGRSMDDQAWITDAGSRDRVWTMEIARTRHAGGSERNRLQDDTLSLGPGSYLVSFVSDGSYSYQSWSGGAPFDSDSWGITVVDLDGLDPEAIELFQPGQDPNTLVSITRVGDDANRQVGFSLDSLQFVRVHAVGEGDSDGMYDYAWIEDTAGRHVWEMTYGATSPAGGASKNRLFNGLVSLPAGDYVARYRTDGSHAFGSWNSTQPDDPFAWGISIQRVPGER